METATKEQSETGQGVGFGARYGLYELLAAGPVSAREVADWSGLCETEISRWLAGQETDGYVVRDEAGRYRCWSFIKRQA